MNAVIAITHDHEEIRGLVNRIGELDDDVDYLIAQLKLRLAAHDAATETQIYRALLQEDPTSSELIGTRVERHRDLEAQLNNVEYTVGSEDFSRSLRDFSDAVTAELDDEESTVLPLLRQVFNSDWLDEAGRRYELSWLAEMDAQTRPSNNATEPTA